MAMALAFCDFIFGHDDKMIIVNCKLLYAP